MSDGQSRRHPEGRPEKTGTLAVIRSDGFQQIDCDDGTVHFLRVGLDGVPGGRVGDRVRLVYEARGSIGAWWGSLLKSDDPGVR